MTAETIAKALGGRKVGSGWIARCPAHDDREPSLSISAGDEGKVLVRCHAGCDQALVIAALRARGLWDDRDRRMVRFVRRETRRAVDEQPHRDDEKRTEAALRLWAASSPALGTPVERYLHSRGLRLPLPASLRYHAALKHSSGGFWPAMVGLVTRGPDAAPLAIHRTFLTRDGVGKAPVVSAKMMLGPCRGGAVRLGSSGDVLMVGEGIETCLAAMQATGRPAWAALSTSGLRALDLPDSIREVIVLADGDKPGEAAARAAALRWKREGRSVRIARPPRGTDFNDLLVGRSPCSQKSAA
ncbi:MAG: virulence-associated protein E [bacterium]|nr:virulence-associated protein E [bacterium]